ncbi:Hypothetical protein CINCED_3A022562 [Cinara cedri]|uniref:Uncharacterized protein n=1 Tax=Cinara cedri TaxID=506608 RepID=A0A5E4M6T1_9HEMI|nr:Hypothetical protein CINCED_3A021392 [Cinara cedri]VVC26469.1 Hypothetical protein CINCED_3A022562 [Cinara cedri]
MPILVVTGRPQIRNSKRSPGWRAMPAREKDWGHGLRGRRSLMAREVNIAYCNVVYWYLKQLKNKQYPFESFLCVLTIGHCAFRSRCVQTSTYFRNIYSKYSNFRTF